LHYGLGCPARGAKCMASRPRAGSPEPQRPNLPARLEISNSRSPETPSRHFRPAIPAVVTLGRLQGLRGLRSCASPRASYDVLKLG
jgi:hypothetical protein